MYFFKNIFGKRIACLEFRIQVVEELLHKYDDAASEQNSFCRPPTVDNPTRFSERRLISHSSHNCET
ncbi:hypothetical protein TNCV_742331 [Trichonephila clavipes]|nr:hypothetical protein TNCV_742331 [Trichonephila clavipes]